MGDLSDLARVIIDGLLEDGMTRKEIGEKVGRSYQTIYDVMKGGEVSLPVLDKLLEIADLELFVRKRRHEA